MLARELMTTPVVTVTEHTSVKEALRLLDRHGITAMPVLDRTGAITGVVSEADLLRDLVDPDPRARALPPEQPPGEPPRLVGDVMSGHPVTVTGSADIADVAEIMSTTAIKSVPVVAEGRVVGIVSRRDIVHMLARADERIAEEIAALLVEAGARPGTIRVVDGVVTLRGPDGARDRRIATSLARTVPGVVRVHIAPADVVADRR